MTFLISALMAAATPQPAFVQGRPVEGQAFVRYVAHSPAGDDIHYYLAPGTSPASPLLVLVQGSGCEPLFARGKKGLRATAGQDLISKDARGRLAVMLVEKPGVESEGARGTFGTADSCSPAYNSVHSLESWTARLSRAIDDARRRRLAGPAPIRLMGLSEGAITVARLARQRADVARVAFISGFGCDQWRDVLVNARRNAEPSKQAEAVSAAENGLRAVAADPRSTTKLFDGQTHLFWSTFGNACPAHDLVSSRAQVMIFTGTEDEQVDPNGVEAITAAFLHAGKPVAVRRIFGGTHMLTTDPNHPLANIVAAFDQALDWLVDSK